MLEICGITPNKFWLNKINFFINSLLVFENLIEVVDLFLDKSPSPAISPVKYNNSSVTYLGKFILWPL